MNPAMRFGRGRRSKKLTALEIFCNKANGFRVRTHTHTHTGTDNRDLLSMIVHFFLPAICPFFCGYRIFFGPSILSFLAVELFSRA